MQIKHLLKRFNELTQNDHKTIAEKERRNSLMSAVSARPDQRKLSSSYYKLKERASVLKLQHVDQHRPSIKTRLLKHSVGIQDRVKRQISLHNNFRAKIEQKMTNFNNLKKQLIFKHTYKPRQTISITQQINKKEKNLRYVESKIQQELLKQKQKQIPEYAQNIMKPCKILPISMTNRPLSAKKSFDYRSQKAIYYKKFAINRKERRATMNLHTQGSPYKTFNVAHLQPWNDQKQDSFMIL